MEDIMKNKDIAKKILDLVKEDNITYLTLKMKTVLI